MSEHICPWWLGYVLANPLRRLLQPPERLLRSCVRPGMTAVDVGAGMGFFSLPMARLAGEHGRVVCIDLQPKMIAGLRKRADRAGLASRIEARVCAPDSLGIGDLAGRVDFALAFAMVHEVPDQRRLLGEISTALRPAGTLLLCEPVGHVPPDRFAATVALAREEKMDVIAHPRLPLFRCVLLAKG